MMKLVPLALLLISNITFADFFCEVKDHKMLTDDGLLTAPKNQYHLGAKFVIDRTTGVVSGKDAPVGDMRVLSVGSSEGAAWKGVTKHLFDRIKGPEFTPLVAMQGNGYDLDYMYIRVYSEEHDKPFIYYDLTSVMTGTCSIL